VARNKIKCPQMRDRASSRKTKRFAIHKPTGYSKIERMFMKYTGEWEQFRLGQRLAVIERLRIAKAKELLNFEETESA
jgi:hypothetical protein